MLSLLQTVPLHEDFPLYPILKFQPCSWGTYSIISPLVTEFSEGGAYALLSAWTSTGGWGWVISSLLVFCFFPGGSTRAINLYMTGWVSVGSLANFTSTRLPRTLSEQVSCGLSFRALGAELFFVVFLFFVFLQSPALRACGTIWEAEMTDAFCDSTQQLSPAHFFPASSYFYCQPKWRVVSRTYSPELKFTSHWRVASVNFGPWLAAIYLFCNKFLRHFPLWRTGGTITKQLHFNGQSASFTINKS